MSENISDFHSQNLKSIMDSDKYHAQALEEIKNIKFLLAKIVGTSNNPTTEQFSSEALEIAAKQFQNLSIERGEWIEEGAINKIFKDIPYRSGQFIIEHFVFSNYFKRGRTYFFNKKDLLELAKNLKERNVDLSRYIEFVNDEKTFQKHIKSIQLKGKTPYVIPNSANDITTSPAKPPSLDLIKADIKKLKTQYHLNGFMEYVDIYRNNHAMLKTIYYFDRYLPSTLKSSLNKWIKDFNYANRAYEMATTHLKLRE